MAVIVDPGRLDAHRRGDKRRGKDRFGIAALEHRTTVADFSRDRQGRRFSKMIRALPLWSLPGLTRQSMRRVRSRSYHFRLLHLSMDHRVKPGGDEV